jgi:nucleoside-diphosphate-sugar epimerase
MREKSIVIAGMGYVGASLAKTLRERGWQVFGISRTGGTEGHFAADLASADSLCALAEKIGPVAWCLHAAASGRGGGEAQYESVYLQGMKNLLVAFPAAQAIFTGSTSVYAQMDGSVVTETNPAEPLRRTGQILREAEKVALAAQGTVLRLAGIYGPGRSVLLRKFLVRESTIDVRTQPPLTPDGRYVNQVHQDDILRAICHVLALPAAVRCGEIFNVSDSTPMLQRRIYERFSEKFCLPLPPEAAPDAQRKRGWSHKQVCNAKLRATGWEPLYPSYFDALERDAALVPSILTQL